MNIDNYFHLSSRERHLHIDQLSLKRDQVSYHDGLLQFHELLTTNHKIALAHNRYPENKDKKFYDLPNEKILNFVGLHKFEKDLLNY